MPQGATSGLQRALGLIDALEPELPCLVSSTSERPSAAEYDFASCVVCITSHLWPSVFYRLR